jgi:hypothetical protein
MSPEDRIKELETALAPFAKYALYMDSNPMFHFLPDNTPLIGLPLAPTLADLKRAAKAMPEQKAVYALPALRRATSGVKPPLLA